MTGLAENFMAETLSPVCGPALMGKSQAMRRLRGQISAIAAHLRTALIVGETSSGNDAVAQELHRLGPVPNQSFTSTSSAALNEARTTDDVRFLLGLDGAPSGTVYLKHVDRLQPPAQALLLQVLNAHANSQPRLRLIVSAARPVTAGSGESFSVELCHLLTAVTLRFPSLAERMEDLPFVAARLLQQWADRTGHHLPTLDAEAMETLQGHTWPGDQRELEEVLLRASIRANGGVITRELVEALLQERSAASDAASSAETPLQLTRLQDVVDRHIVQVLGMCQGNKVRAAETLGISRSTLYRMLDALAPQASSIN